MSLSKWKKALTIGLASCVAVGISGVAAAYFTSSGSGTGSATVGSPTPFTVKAGTATGTLYPATPPYTGATATITFTIKNISPGNEHYSIGAGTATIVEATGTTTIAGTPAGTNAVPGCKATWFGASSTAKSGTLATTATTTDAVTVHMVTTPTSTLQVCSGHTPYVTLSFSS